MAITAPDQPVVGNGELVRIGPGKLWVAPFGTALPTALADAPNAAFREVGFTTEGSVVNYSQTSDGVEVAERLRPIKSIITGVELTFEVTLAQLSMDNLALAMNAGPTAITETANERIFVWPKSGGTSRVSMIWQSDDNLEREVLVKCFAGGDIAIPRRKGVEPAALNITFTVEENSTVEVTIDGDDLLPDAYYIQDVDLDTAAA
jgi:hypothetical protein